MEFFPDEKVLLESDTKQLLLTTHRVRFEAKRSGFARVTSIMLEELASSEITSRSYPALLVLAAALTILGIITAVLVWRDNAGAGVFIAVVSLVLASVFLVIYFVTRSQVISLGSAAASINAQTVGMSLEAAKRFIDMAEAAKNKRYMQSYDRLDEIKALLERVAAQQGTEGLPGSPPVARPPIGAGRSAVSPQKPGESSRAPAPISLPRRPEESVERPEPAVRTRPAPPQASPAAAMVPRGFIAQATEGELSPEPEGEPQVWKMDRIYAIVVAVVVLAGLLIALWLVSR